MRRDIRKIIKTACPWACLLLLAACSNANVAKLNETRSDNKIPSVEAISSNDQEKVDVPSNISGSYLVCAIRKQAKADDLNAQYGCRLNAEGTTEKLDLTALKQQVAWTSGTPGVTIVELEATNIWHAYYNLKAPSLDAINKLGAALDVQVRYDSPTAPQAVVKQAKVLQVLQPAIEYGDTTAPVVVEGGGINPNDAATL